MYKCKVVIPSQNVVPGPVASALPGNLLEMKILRSHPNILNKKFWV